MRIKNNILVCVILMISILMMVGCKKNEKEEIRRNIKTIVKGKVEKKIVSPNIREVKVYGKDIGGNRYAGVSFEKNEFYIVDHHTERKNGKLLLEMIDMNTGEIKDKKRLLMGDYHSPACFTDTFANALIPVYVYYFNNNYYILNYNKIVFLDKDLACLKATFFDYDYSEFSFSYLSFFKKGNKRKVLIGYKHEIYTGNTIRKETENRFRSGILDLSFKDKLSWEKTVDLKKIKVDMVHSDESGGINLYYMYYIVPLSSGFIMDGNMFYSYNFEQGYYVRDIDTGKTVFIKLEWLNPTVYTDKDAYNIGTYRMKDWSNNPRTIKAGGRIFYNSYKGKLYFLRMVKVGRDRIGFVSGVDSKKKLMFMDIIKSDNGDYEETIVLPFGTFFGKELHEVSAIRKSFFIDYEKGIYVYGDRTKEWDDIVRYCRFKLPKKNIEISEKEKDKKRGNNEGI